MEKFKQKIEELENMSETIDKKSRVWELMKGIEFNYKCILDSFEAVAELETELKEVLEKIEKEKKNEL